MGPSECWKVGIRFGKPFVEGYEIVQETAKTYKVKQDNGMFCGRIGRVMKVDVHLVMESAIEHFCELSHDAVQSLKRQIKNIEDRADKVAGGDLSEK